MAIQTLPDGTEYDDSIPCFTSTGQRFDPFAIIAQEQLDDEGPTLPFDGEGLSDEDLAILKAEVDGAVTDVFDDVTGND